MQLSLTLQPVAVFIELNYMCVVSVTLYNSVIVISENKIEPTTLTL